MTNQSSTREKISSNEEIQGKIQGMFYMLQTTTEKFLEELDRSYALYKIGEKTAITKKLEKLATTRNVGQMETDLISKLLKTINALGKKVVIEGFVKNLDVVAEAYILSETENRILYGLVPKAGQEQKLRSLVAEFYSNTSNWEMFKYTETLFQIIPKELKDKVKFLSQIKSA